MKMTELLSLKVYPFILTLYERAVPTKRIYCGQIALENTYESVNIDIHSILVTSLQQLWSLISRWEWNCTFTSCVISINAFFSFQFGLIVHLFLQTGWLTDNLCRP